jgi:hypothetical protein
MKQLWHDLARRDMLEVAELARDPIAHTSSVGTIQGAVDAVECGQSR